MIISKLDESYLRIECDLDVAQELSDTFSFLVPGYEFSPKQDGHISLLNITL